MKYKEENNIAVFGNEESFDDLLRIVLGPWGFPCDSAGKKSACNARDLGWIPGLGRSPGEGKGYPLQYFGLENSMDCTVMQRISHDLQHCLLKVIRPVAQTISHA